MKESKHHNFIGALKKSEEKIDLTTRNRLKAARENALNASPWFRPTSYWRASLASIPVLVILIALPLTDNVDNRIAEQPDSDAQSLQLLVEDPDFYLWLSQSAPLTNS